MLFNSPEFLLFLVAVFLLHRRLDVRGQNLLILVASYFFLGWWDWRFLGLLLTSTVVDYTVARRMHRADTQTTRKRWLLLSLCTNLGLLGFFKYFGFFVDSTAVMLETLGFQANLPTLQIILPVGISFYTFQTLAYTIDVYRGRIEPTRDPVVFGVYVSYFPQLVAGPIERAQHLMPQFARRRHADWGQVYSGMVLFLIGAARKVAVADVVAPTVDRIFTNPGAASSAELALGVLLFALQIYGDFCGYSDMARGTSRMFGVELMENFNHPYFATNITVFWRRWHISLSTWLRDYLYISLGGNRGPRWFVYRNLMLTMLLGGLWHGAAWTFVVWGGLHGVALALHKLWLRGRKPPDRAPIDGPWRLARAVTAWALTMALVCLAWVFFRAPDFGVAWQVLAGLFELRGGVPLRPLLLFAATSALLLFIDLPQYLTRDHNAVERWPWWAQGLTYAALIWAAVLPDGYDNPFIYFQF